jgi:hypothetical protein
MSSTTTVPIRVVVSIAPRAVSTVFFGALVYFPQEHT